MCYVNYSRNEWKKKCLYTNKVLPSWARVRLTWVWRLQREPGTGSLSWCSRSCRLPTHQCREYFDLRDLQGKKRVVLIKCATSQYSNTSFKSIRRRGRRVSFNLHPTTWRHATVSVCLLFKELISCRDISNGFLEIDLFDELISTLDNFNLGFAKNNTPQPVAICTICTQFACTHFEDEQSLVWNVWKKVRRFPTKR